MSRAEMEEAIASIRTNYARYVACGTGADAHDDPKAYAAHHAAGRAALNHLEQLLELTEGGDADAEAVSEALNQARDAMNADLGRDRADDDGDDA